MKSNQTIFVFLIAFFLVIGLGSLLLFGSGGSLINRNSDSFGATTAALSETIIANSTTSVDFETPVEQAIIEDITDIAGVDEEKAEEIVENLEGEVTTEEKKEVETSAPAYETRYFMYTITTERHALRLRQFPSENARILKKLNKNTSGYVIKPGNEWCKVITVGGLEGYLSTEYLTLEEMTEQDFPVDFVSKVQAPDEELNY